MLSALVFTIISYIITDNHNLAEEGVRCSYKGRMYYNNDQNNTLSKPGSILQNTHACADNENNPITERTGKVKIREVETRAKSFFLPKYEQIQTFFTLFISKVLRKEMSLFLVGTFFLKFRK